MHVAQMIDSLHVGGAEKLLVTFAAARPRDVRVAVISLRHDPGSPIPAELRALGADVATFPARRLLDLRRLGQVVRFLRRERIAVLHTHLTYANIVGALAGRLAGVPVVATLHSAGLEPRHHALIHRLEACALRAGARRIIAVGDTVAQAHRPRLGGTPITVIRNAVAAAPMLAPTERAGLRAEINGDPARPLLISVGRLSALKGYFDLLDAFAALHAIHPTAALVIVGDGPLRVELTAKIEELELTGHAVLLGTRNDVPALLAASDLYVSSSHVEGLPLSLLEAMAAGLPVVATRVGEVPQLLADGLGLLVPPREPMTLAATLRTLLDDPVRMQSMGAAAREHVVRNHSPAAWVDQVLSVYAAARAYQRTMNGNPKEQRSLEQLKRQYQIERELATRLRNSGPEARRELYSRLYDELYQRVPDHPQLMRKADPQAASATVGRQMRLLGDFLRPETVFLEIGPGDCSLSFAVARHVRKVFAVDVSAEITKQLNPPSNFELVISDGTGIPVPGASVDVAYSNQLMEHLHPDDAFKQLQNIYRVLAVGGVYICITPHRLSGPHDVSRYFDKVATGFHIKEYTVTELANLFRRVGFSRISVYTNGEKVRINVPLFLFVVVESLLGSLPFSVRKRVVTTKPFKVLLSTAIVGRKEERES